MASEVKMLGRRISAAMRLELRRMRKCDTVALKRQYLERTEVQLFAELTIAAMRLVRGANALPRVLPYRAHLESKGLSRREAQFLARMVLYFGTLLLNERASCKQASSLLRRIVKSKLDHVPVTAIELQTIPSLAGMPESFRNIENELSDVLAPAGTGDEGACRELQRLARSILEHLPSSRGRPLQRASVTHEMLLRCTHGMTPEDRAVCDPVDGYYCDPATKATAAVFGDKSFNPRRAQDRYRAHQNLKPGPGAWGKGHRSPAA